MPAQEAYHFDQKACNTQDFKGIFTFKMSDIFGGKKSGGPENRPACASKDRG